MGVQRNERLNLIWRDGSENHNAFHAQSVPWNG